VKTAVNSQLKLAVAGLFVANAEGELAEIRSCEAFPAAVTAIVVEKEGDATSAQQRESAAFEGSIFRSLPAPSAAKPAL